MREMYKSRYLEKIRSKPRPFNQPKAEPVVKAASTPDFAALEQKLAMNNFDQLERQLRHQQQQSRIRSVGNILGAATAIGNPFRA